MSFSSCIRVFKTQQEANRARDIIKQEGFHAYVTEDGFGELKLKDLGMTSRFRLYVNREDIDAIGKFLARKLKEKKLEE